MAALRLLFMGDCAVALYMLCKRVKRDDFKLPHRSVRKRTQIHIGLGEDYETKMTDDKQHLVRLLVGDELGQLKGTSSIMHALSFVLASFERPLIRDRFMRNHL